MLRTLIYIPTGIPEFTHSFYHLDAVLTSFKQRKRQKANTRAQSISQLARLVIR